MSKWHEIRCAEPQNEETVAPVGMDAVEQAFEKQYDEALIAFQERREKENKRFKDITDTNYYFVVCFSNNAQMTEFCNEFGLDVAFKYYDGREIARQFRKAIRTPDMGSPTERPKNKDYMARAKKPKATY